jgi:phosphoglycerate dehydrogenase-like enzyme
MYQGYWQTTVGIELRGKILGLIGLGRVGSAGCKNWQSIWNAGDGME